MEEIKETLRTHNNRIQGVGLRLGESISFACYEDLKAKIADEHPNLPFGLFPDCWSLISFCNLSYVSEDDYLDRGKKVLGNKFVSLLDARAAALFDERYPRWLVGAQKEF